MGTYIVSTAGVYKSFPDLRVERARRRQQRERQKSDRFTLK